MSKTYEKAQAYIEAIEAAMRAIGLWSDEPLPDEAYHFGAPFGMDTMAFSQWLQFIFLPRVREIISGRGQFPSTSQVAAQAVHEFDGMDEANDLTSLLVEFDDWINRGCPA